MFLYIYFKIFIKICIKFMDEFGISIKEITRAGSVSYKLEAESVKNLYTLLVKINYKLWQGSKQSTH